MSDLSDYPDQWECLCMIDSRGDPLPEIEVVPQERVARLTAALDEAKLGLKRISHGTYKGPISYGATESADNTLDRISTIERGSDD